MAYPRPPPDIPINEAISQVDQQITLCLQRIDAHFAAAHETIQGAILPKVARYGEHSLQIGEAARFWRMFFESSSQLHLAQLDPEEDEQEDASQNYEMEHSGALFDSQDDMSTLDASHDQRAGPHQHQSPRSFNDSLLASPPARGHISPPRPSLGALRDDDYDHDRRAHQSTGAADRSDESVLTDATPRGKSVPQPSLESPFAKAKRDLEKRNAAREDGRDRRSSFDDDLSSSISMADLRLSTPRAASKHTGRHEEDQEGETATPPQVSRESLDPSAMNKRRTSLAAAAAANMTRNRFGTKIVGTPIAGVPEGTKPTNPFTNVAESPAKQVALSGGQRAGKATGTPQPSSDGKEDVWNGIADLRHTSIRAAGAAGSSPMRPKASPPVLMQFSMPRSRWLKTPAKEAARKVVDDLLRTAERHGPSANELITRRHAEYEMARGTPSRAQGLFQDDLPESGHRGYGSASRGGGATPTSRDRARRSELPTPPTVTAYPAVPARTALLASNQGNDTSLREAASTASRSDEEPPSSRRLMDEGEDLGISIPTSAGAAAGPLSRFSAQTLAPHAAAPPADDSESDSDDDSDDSDDSDEGPGMGRPGATGLVGSGGGEASRANPTPSSASLLSSRSGLSSDLSAVQALKDDTLFGSKLGANPFLFGSVGSSAPNSASGSVSGSVPRRPAAFAPRGNVGDLGTFNMGRPLVGDNQDVSSPLKDWRGTEGASRK